MRTEEIIDMVRQRGGYDSSQEAREATTAVLTVLAGRDLGGEANNLAAQLPRDLGELLSQETQHGEQFSAEEFISRIQQRLNISGQAAETAARAVLSSVTDAVSSGELTSFVNALPKDLSKYAARD